MFNGKTEDVGDHTHIYELELFPGLFSEYLMMVSDKLEAVTFVAGREYCVVGFLPTSLVICI